MTSIPFSFTKETLAVLKNFSTINQSIKFSNSEKIRTISSAKSIIASAQLNQIIPSEAAIYDLQNFLSALSMIEDPVLRFYEKYVNIASNNAAKAINYYYADASTILLPPDKNPPVKTWDVEFSLTENAISDIKKASAVLSLGMLGIIGDGIDVNLVTLDVEHGNNNRYSETVFKSDAEFEAYFTPENLKIMNGAYDVKLSSRGAAYFQSLRSDDISIEYFISLESNSKF